jgi:hypothetical protein
LRRFLGTAMVGSVVLFVYALFHGFSGSYCIHSYAQAGCGENLTLQGGQVAWLAPVVFFASMLLRRALSAGPLPVQRPRRGLPEAPASAPSVPAQQPQAPGLNQQSNTDLQVSQVTSLVMSRGQTEKGHAAVTYRALVEDVPAPVVPDTVQAPVERRTEGPAAW